MLCTSTSIIIIIVDGLNFSKDMHACTYLRSLLEPILSLKEKTKPETRTRTTVPHILATNKNDINAQSNPPTMPVRLSTTSYDNSTPHAPHVIVYA